MDEEPREGSLPHFANGQPEGTVKLVVSAKGYQALTRQASPVPDGVPFEVNLMPLDP